MKRCALSVAGLLLISGASTVKAQEGLSIWAGVGEASTSGSSTFGTAAKQLGVQFAIPLMPVAVRADAILLGDGFSTDRLAYTVNGVVRMALPIFQPYAIVGQGRYNRTPTETASGWNAGGGVRLGVARFGVFFEVRRHFPVRRTITTFGVTF